MERELEGQGVLFTEEKRRSHNSGRALCNCGTGLLAGLKLPSKSWRNVTGKMVKTANDAPCLYWMRKGNVKK